MKKTFASAVVLAAALGTSPASAHHGQGYDISACGTDGNTAHMTITTVGIYDGENAKIKEVLQQTFNDLLKRHTSADHAAVTPAYVDDLINTFGAQSTKLVVETGHEYVQFDFNHPNDKAPSTPGCAP